MKFKDFITEKYLEGSKAPLYHWTSWVMFKYILKHSALGVIDKWEPIEGVISLKKGWVSFTRDKNYRIRGKDSDIRISFDPIILKQKGYKIQPYVDRSVVGNLHDEDRLPQDKARWEAEEMVLGPIKLKDGMMKIEVTKERYDEEQKIIKRFEESLKDTQKINDQLEDGTFRWTIDFWKKQKGPNGTKGFEKFIEKAEEELKKDPNWKPKGFEDRIKNQLIRDQEYIDEIKKLLDQVEVLK
jgi:hypothetical protein